MPTKRKSDINHADSVADQPVPKKTKTIVSIPTWSDIPVWTRPDSPFLQLPVEILDQIVSENSGLTRQDYLALAGTCKQIRGAFTEKVWREVLDWEWEDPGFPEFTTDNASLLNRLFSGALENSLKDQKPGSPNGVTGDNNSVGSCLETVVAYVNAPITKAEAKRMFKFKNSQLDTIKQVDTPTGWLKDGLIRRYKEAAVRSLALKLHGGPVGLEMHLSKLAITKYGAKESRYPSPLPYIYPPDIYEDWDAYGDEEYVKFHKAAYYHRDTWDPYGYGIGGEDDQEDDDNEECDDSDEDEEEQIPENKTNLHEQQS